MQFEVAASQNPANMLAPLKAGPSDSRGSSSSGAGDADSGQITDKGRVLPCTGVLNGGSLTVWFRVSLVSTLTGRSERSDGTWNDRQQTLNCALSVDPDFGRGCPVRQRTGRFSLEKEI